MADKPLILVRLGKYLRSVREKRKLSQEELADLAGVHRTYVGGVERGEYNVTMLTLKRFTDTLGISIVDAVQGMEHTTRKR